MTVIVIPGSQAGVEQSGRPAIPEGRYLAAVVDVEPKLNEKTGSYGMNWSLLVNLGTVEQGWSTELRSVPIKHYTYIGKMENGVVSDTSNGFKTWDMMKALGQNNGVLDTDKSKFRQVVVTIRHEPDDDGNVWPRVNKVLSYEVNNELAPVLQHLAEAAAAEQKPTAPTASAEPEF